MIMPSTPTSRLSLAELWDRITHFSISVDDLSQWRNLIPLAVAGIVVWALWLYRFFLSRLAGPIENDFTTTTSVVVPSFHEDPDILMRCLDSWRQQNPDEIIIVLDVADTEAYERLVALDDPRINPILFKHAGKRSALGVGIRAATSERARAGRLGHRWEPGLLKAVQMPFVDPTVGGGRAPSRTCYQRTTSIWRRVADWLVNLRYYDYVPGDGPGRRGRLRVGPDRRRTGAASSCRCWRTWRTSSSSAGAASPVTTAGSPGWCSPPATRPCTSRRRRRCRCSRPPSAPSSSSGSAGAATRTAAT